MNNLCCVKKRAAKHSDHAAIRRSINHQLLHPSVSLQSKCRYGWLVMPGLFESSAPATATRIGRLIVVEIAITISVQYECS
jgi:hypothetical protein